MVRGMAKLGATDADLADALEVSISCVRKWRVRYPEFAEATNLAKGDADASVERSLFERARGYNYQAVKIHFTKDGDAVEHPYIEHVPPDTTAALAWLNNRQPESWRNRREVDADGNVTVIVQGGLPARKRKKAGGG